MESEVLQLAGAQDQASIVTCNAGPAADVARSRGIPVVVAGRSLESLVHAFAGARVIHVHTINNHPLVAMAAQLAGARVIVQTLHNRVRTRLSAVAGATFLPNPALLDLLELPSRGVVVPNSIPAPPTPPASTPWFQAGRPLRIIEIRRPDKAVHFTLEDLLAAGALDGIPHEALVIGPSGTPTLPGVRRIGLLDDPAPCLADADFLLSGSSEDTFGRTAWEAMAHGAVPLLTDLPPFRHWLGSDDRHAFLLPSEIQAAAARVHAIATAAPRDPGWEDRRRRNHQLVRETGSPGRIAAACKGVCDSLASSPETPPHDLLPDDAPPSSLHGLSSACAHALAGDATTALAAASGLQPRAAAVAHWFLAEECAASLPASTAHQLLRRAHRALGDRPHLLLALARSCRAVGQARQARLALRRCLDLDCSPASVLLELLDLELASGDIGAGELVYRRLIAQSPHLAGLPQAAAAA